MQFNKLLTWRGKAWPTASAHEKILQETRDLPRGAWPYVRELTTTGNGREYKLIGAQGFWRNFADIRQDDELAVTSFVRRRGDIFGDLTPETPSTTKGWNAVAQRLSVVASFWTPADANGVSRWSEEDARRIAVSKDILAANVFTGDIYFDLRMDNGELAASIRPRTLAGFMLASALFHLNAKPDMRHCAQCGDWYAIGRSDSRFCSPSCRSMHATQSKGTR